MNTANFGFTYITELVRDGKVIERSETKNLIPIEGLNHIIATALKNGTPFANWYVGLYEGNYTPTPDDTMATFPAAATELTAYTSSTRPILVLGDVANGQVSNGTLEEPTNLALFTGNASNKSAVGAFVSSAPTKGATSGVLISAARFSAPKALSTGDVLRVSVVFNTASI